MTRPSLRSHRGTDRRGHSARWLLPILAVALLAGGRAAASETRLTCDEIPNLTRQLLRKHISFYAMNEELRGRAVDTYVEQLDPAKSLYLQPEIKALKADLLSIFLDVRAGDCSRLTKIQADIVKRYGKMEEFVRELVSSEEYEVDPSVELIVDPKKRRHPVTAEERDELYTKLVHFQMSNYLSTDIEMAEAKEKLVHRYELGTKRAREATTEDILSVFLNSFAMSLDPHSNYLSAEADEDFKIQMKLSLDGIGVALSSRDGYSIVEKIIPGGAADRLNILEPQDKIIAVAQEDGEFVDIIDMELRDVVRLIRGERGTKVRLTVLRQADKVERFPVTIVRDKIDLEEQAATIRYEDVTVGDETYKLAILELPSFYGGRGPEDRQSSNDVRRLLTEANEAGAHGLLLDLSRNGGGLLDHSVEIAGYFIDQGGVVAIRDTLSKVSVLTDPNPGSLFNGPMVILTSRVSASASEIVAGALKDYKRALVVGGDHTFGKGTVQSMVQLPPGLGSIKVTTALYFRPGGQSTQNAGVAADIALPSRFSTEDFGENYQTYSLPSQRIHSFLELDAGPGNGDETRWKPVTPGIVEQLRAKSKTRVSQNEEFAEIEESLEKVRERAGVIRLADLIAEREEEAASKEPETDEDGGGTVTQDGTDAGEENAGEEDSETANSDEAPPSPQLLEAIQILSDYVALMNS